MMMSGGVPSEINLTSSARLFIFSLECGADMLEAPMDIYILAILSVLLRAFFPECFVFADNICANDVVSPLRGTQ
jgi:hypothetical protein